MATKKNERCYYCGIDCKQFDGLNPFPLWDEPKGWCTPQGRNKKIPCNPEAVANKKTCFMPK